MEFIRIFDNEKEADDFAMIHHTKAIVRYDWDEVFGIIRQYVVSY